MPASHVPGTFCWIDLVTADMEAATRFYTELFGWGTRDMGGPGQPYSMIDIAAKDIGGMLLLSRRDREAGMPPHWLPYVTTMDAAATMAALRENGGESVVEPCAVGTAGFAAVARDPQGAVFALWQPRDHAGAGVIGRPGAMTWNELGTSDLDGARRFYRAVFGWSSQPMPIPGFKYEMLLLGERKVGGMYPFEGDMAGLAPHWMTYFEVEDCDEAAARAVELGGEIHVQPTDIPEVGRFAMLRDPQGAWFCVIRTTAMPS